MQRLMTFGLLSFCLSACGVPASNALMDSNTSEGALSDACDLSGTWAIRFEIPVSWPATLAVEPGQSTVYQWAKAARTQQGASLVDDLSVCGVTTPDNHAREVFKNEVYGITFPNSLFDSNKLPHVQVSHTLQASAPGSAFTSQAVTVVLGLTLDNAAAAVWPLRGNQVSPVDSDADGLPGITVEASNGTGYAYPPVNMFRTKRAAKFYIALRNVVQSVAGQVDSCDRMTGTATIPIIAGKAAINSRIVGCQRTDGAQCTSAEYELIDKLQSGYDLAGTANVVMQRVDPATTCAQVRAARY